MGLSTWTKAGIAAGGVSKGMNEGIRGLAEMMAAENATKRTELMGQEVDIRKKAAERTEEEYQRGMESIPVETARKGFSTPEEADYHEGFARSIGAIRKDESGNEFIMRKDAVNIMGLMKSKEFQEDKDAYIRGVLQEKVTKAEKDAEEQPELKAHAEGLRKRLYDHEAKMGYNKLTPVPKNSRLVNSAGKVVLEADEKDQEVTSNVGINPKTGKKEFLFKDGSFSGVEATKVKGAGSDLADEIRAERLAMAKDEAERKKIDEQYKRKERIDDDWEREEKEYRKQYQDDLEEEEEPGTEKGYRAKTNWNANMAAMRKKYESRYKAIGLDLQGNPIEKSGGGLAGMAKLPTSQGEQAKPTQQPGKKGEMPKPVSSGKKIRVKFEKDEKGKVWGIWPDGTEKEVDMKPDGTWKIK